MTNLPKFIVYRAEFDNDRLTDKYIREEIAQKYQLVKTVGEMEIYQLNQKLVFSFSFSRRYDRIKHI